MNFLKNEVPLRGLVHENLNRRISPMNTDILKKEKLKEDLLSLRADG
jgi:hypothetical protein